MLSVVNNMSAMNAQRHFNIVGINTQKSSEKLSSGYRINRAADDAAGLSISESMRSLIRGMNQGARNIQDGIGIMQVADGALAEVHDMLHRMTELSIQAANGTYGDSERHEIQAEINQLTAEIDRIGDETTYNNLRILDNGKTYRDAQSAADLVKCGSAAKGFMGESYEYGGKYYPAAILDFSTLDASRIKQLNDKSFSFVCGFGCGETFKFTFVDGTASGMNPDTTNSETGGVQHNYYVGTRGLTNGSQLAQKLYQTVADNPISGYSGDYLGGKYVSHRAAFVNPGGSKLIVVQGKACNSPEEAANSYPVGNNTTRGKMDCSEILSTDDGAVNNFLIQCSNVLTDEEKIETYRMNTKVLGIHNLDVTTQTMAKVSIDRISHAIDKICEHRSAYGAFQNRLEHSYNANNNTAENLTAAESRVRDTDMASEMVKFSNSNILAQAGNAVLSQAMDNHEMVLNLLQ